MKNIIISLILMSISVFIQGQCDGFEPSNPIQHTTSVWDWRDESTNNWYAYVPNENNVGTLFYLYSPFEPNLFYDDNVNDLFATSPERDYHPQDGWELVYKAFGTGSTDFVKNPGFVLYNRFTGMLRSFVYVRTDLGQGITDGALSISFASAQDKASAALTFVQSKSNALDDFVTNQTANVANVYNNSNTGEWFRSDVIIAYDPCTCSSSENEGGILTPNLSQMVIKPKLYNSGDLCLVSPTDVSAYSNCLVGSGQFLNSGIKPIYPAAPSPPSTIPQPGNKVNTSATSFLSDAVTINNLLNPNLNGQSIKLKELWVFDPLFKDFSGLSTVLSLVNFLVVGASKSTTTTQAVANQTTATSYYGTLEHVFETDGYSFYTPGSPHESVTSHNPTNKPVYDYVMGVMNMLTTPKLEYVQYNCDENHFPTLREDEGDCSSSNAASACDVQIDMPQLWQFRLKEEPKFAINPASELQLLDIEYALDYRLHKNQGEVNDNSLGATTNIGSDHQSRRSSYGVFQDCGNYVITPTIVYPMIGPVFQRESGHGLPYEQKLRDQGIYLTSWPRESSSSPGTGFIDKKTFSTGFFPAQCWDEQSFMFAHHPLNFTNPTKYSYNNDARFYFPNLEVILRVKAILRRTDSEATAETEDLIMISSYNCSWSSSPLNLPFSNNPNLSHTYELNTGTICVDPNNMYKISSEFGADYFVAVLNDKNNPGSSVFPLGNAQYPYDDYISGVISLPNSERRASRNNSIINNASLSVPSGSAEVVASNEIIVSGNTTISGNINLKIGYVSGCGETEIPQPLTQTSILTQYCPSPALYNPVITRSMEEHEIANFTESERTNSWSLYPNPSFGQTKLLYQSNDELLTLQVFDMLGGLVFSKTISGRENSTDLDFSDLSPGIYTVNVSSPENCSV